jgi:hypothetical protein
MSAASFTCFLPSPAAPPRSAEAVRIDDMRTDYTVKRVTPLRGAASSGIEPGQPWSRLERTGALAVPDAPFIGSTQHVVYTDTTTRSDLSQISSAPSGPVAVLIPIGKSPSWWALAQDERQAYFSQGRGHTALGRRFASRIYRRLYHARYLPGSGWDFLTYFEFPEAERNAFEELLSLLRDPAQNPEWTFVDRELEIWFQKRGA